MSTALIAPETRAELATETQESAESVALLESFEITGPSDLEFAGSLLVGIKTKLKDLEAKRTSVTGPINAGLKALNDLFRPAKEHFEAGEKALKGKIAAYTVQAKAAAVLALPAVAAGDAPLTALAPVVAPAGVSVTEAWDYEIVDEALVPRQFCSPDDAKIKGCFTDPIHGLTPSLPGVRFFKTGKVRVRT